MGHARLQPKQPLLLDAVLVPAVSLEYAAFESEQEEGPLNDLLVVTFNFLSGPSDYFVALCWAEKE